MKIRLCLVQSCFIAILCAACTAPQSAEHTSCAPLGMTTDQLTALKTNGYDLKHPGPMAIAMVDCLGDPDPSIRDGIAYEGITHWLRGGQLTDPEIRDLKDALLSALRKPDKAGFRSPFAALVLSEVARADRISPYLTDEEFSAFVGDAAVYMASITDYRGYDNAEGWRHGVAHTADWFMQLALNPRANKADLEVIRKAVASQIAPPDHAYIHGESERLARPILFSARHDAMTEEGWTQWMAAQVDPAPMADWGAAFKSEEGLARLHNLKAFLNAVYVNASASSNENVKRLLPGTTEALRSLP